MCNKTCEFLFCLRISKFILCFFWHQESGLQIIIPEQIVCSVSKHLCCMTFRLAPLWQPTLHYKSLLLWRMFLTILLESRYFLLTLLSLITVLTAVWSLTGLETMECIEQKISVSPIFRLTLFTLWL